MSIATRRMGIRTSPNEQFKGGGFVAGRPPPAVNPDELDGRTKILNIPSRVRVHVYERMSMVCVGSVLSAADGTWEVARLSIGRRYLIVGLDGTGQHNAAVQDWIVPALPDPDS